MTVVQQGKTINYAGLSRSIVVDVPVTVGTTLEKDNKYLHTGFVFSLPKDKVPFVCERIREIAAQDGSLV